MPVMTQLLQYRWCTHLEGAEVLSYLVSCRVETGVSHPGLATGTEGCYFLGSWGVWGFPGQGSGGSLQAGEAVRGRRVHNENI